MQNDARKISHIIELKSGDYKYYSSLPIALRACWQLGLVNIDRVTNMETGKRIQFPTYCKKEFNQKKR